MGGTVRLFLPPYSLRSDYGILRLCWCVYSIVTYIHAVIDYLYVSLVFVRYVERCALTT